MTQPSTDMSSKALFMWLWRGYLRQHVPLLMVSVVFMAIEGSTLGALSYMMQPMFDLVFVEGDGLALYWVGAVIMAIFTIRAISGVAQKMILARIAMRSAAALRFDLLDRIMQQDGAFHKDHPPGYLIQRVQGDVGAINKVWRTVITGAGRDAIALVVLIGVAISVDPIWALLACVGTPVLVLPATFITKFVRQQARIARELSARISTRLDEIFHGIVPVKLNALEAYQSKQYRDLTHEAIDTSLRTNFGTAIIPGMIDVMAGVGFFAVLLYGGSEIISGDKTVGQFMTFFTAMGFAFDPLRRLGAMSGVWQVAAAAIERLRELIEKPLSLTSPVDPEPAPTQTPQIVLDQVSLAYDDTPVLRGVSFTAEPGQTTALVGASGAGKSTIFNLLTRLVDPHEGAARIGGVATTRMDLDGLRGLFSVVTQEALLFDETIRENILLGRTDVSDDVLQGVLDAAHVTDFVTNMPDGLDTPVGPRGSALSGGQRQRVVIARALLRNTPVLLLDEATSALDAQSEQVVQDALDKLSEGRTTLVIAHRLSTIRGADKIVVMDRGRVVDEGSHDDLLLRGGIYADLYRLQFQDGKAVVDVAAAKTLDSAPDIDPEPRRGLLRRMAGLLK